MILIPFIIILDLRTLSDQCTILQYLFYLWKVNVPVLLCLYMVWYFCSKKVSLCNTDVQSVVQITLCKKQYILLTFYVLHCHVKEYFVLFQSDCVIYYCPIKKTLPLLLILPSATYSCGAVPAQGPVVLFSQSIFPTIANIAVMWQKLFLCNQPSAVARRFFNVWPLFKLLQDFNIWCLPWILYSLFNSWPLLLGILYSSLMPDFCLKFLTSATCL